MANKHPAHPCVSCGRETRNLKHCSVDCRFGERVLSHCKGCGEQFDRNRRNNRRQTFCTKQCANRSNAKKRVVVRQCAFCDSPIGRNAKKFCSTDCQTSHDRAQYIARWLDGDETGTTAAGFIAAPVKAWIRELRGDGCWTCGWAEVNPVTGKVPTQIDHIDGDALNNRPGNLRLLCPNHHSLTDTFGNIGGRKSSRTWRYAKP